MENNFFEFCWNNSRKTWKGMKIRKSFDMSQFFVFWIFKTFDIKKTRISFKAQKFCIILKYFVEIIGKISFNNFSFFVYPNFSFRWKTRCEITFHLKMSNQPKILTHPSLSNPLPLIKIFICHCLHVTAVFSNCLDIARHWCEKMENFQWQWDKNNLLIFPQVCNFHSLHPTLTSFTLHSTINGLYKVSIRFGWWKFFFALCCSCRKFQAKNKVLLDFSPFLLWIKNFSSFQLKWKILQKINMKKNL